MKIELTEKEVEFLLEVLYWGKIAFEEKAQKYLDSPIGDMYRKNDYNPRIDDYNNFTKKIKESKNENTSKRFKT